VCIRCRGNVFTEPLPNNDRVMYIQTHRIIGGTYEVRRRDALRCHDVHTKFHEDWFRHSKVDWGRGFIDTQHGELIKLLSCFQNTESRLKMNHWNLHVLVPPCSSAIQHAYLQADHDELTALTDVPELPPTMVKVLSLTTCDLETYKVTVKLSQCLTN
jgi:hypothetical protein